MKKIVAEFTGVALLLMAVVGSGIMASALTDIVAIQLLINAVSAALMLVVVINLFGDVSGAHFNPVVTLFKTFKGEVDALTAIRYILAQLLGAIAGTTLANVMFETDPIGWSEYERMRTGTFIAEVVATAGLLLIIHLKSDKAALLIPAWIGSAYFFASSTSFANPAVTVGRMFTSTWAGIKGSSVPGFVLAQLLGLVVILIVTFNYRRREKVEAEPEVTI